MDHARGVAADFPSPQEYVGALTFGFQPTTLHIPLGQLQRFIQEGAGFRFDHGAGPTTFSLIHVAADLYGLFAMHRRIALTAALRGQGDWQPAWAASVSYGYWSVVVGMELRRTEIQANAGTGRRIYTGPLWHRYGGLLGDCLALGWMEYANDLTDRALWVERMDGFVDFGPDYQRATQRFVVRLMERARAGRDVPGLGEPVFDALLANWRSADPAALRPLLLAACDRHTHQCKSTATNEEYDIPFAGFWYDPFEILAVLRLRSLQGLDNPVLDHPLLRTPLGTLPPVSAPREDELLAAVVARFRREKLPT